MAVMATMFGSQVCGENVILLFVLSFILEHSQLANGLVCYCDGNCPNNEQNGTCITSGQCFLAGEKSENAVEPTISYGCLPPQETGFMQCKATQIPHYETSMKAISCCSSGDQCNLNLTLPEFRNRTKSSSSGFEDHIARHYIAFIASFVTCAVIFLVLIVFVYRWFKRREARCEMQLLRNKGCGPYLTSNGTLQDLIDQSSGSGSGLPLLVQRTIAKQLHMVKSVGKGRYGEVWLAQWRGEPVAVKVFFTTEEASWFRETDIYQTVLMRHENILGFIAADIKGNGSWTQMLLITDYHERGSLHDYLQTHVLDTSSLLTMTLSIASGLAHLHAEIFGTKGKPAISHRDIKSKNILVKRDGQCVIADFGLAVRYLSDRDEIDIASNQRVGTIRYMAPEVLGETLDTAAFEAFKMADMYSFGLVLWELCSRTVTGDKQTIVDDYRLPYWDCVPSDPSFKDMYDVVCVKKMRPCIPIRWESEELLRTLGSVMQECWHHHPGVRLTALRVKKTLCKLGTDNTLKIV